MSDPGAERGGAGPVELRGVLPAGTLLRGYELKAILGQGAFGITYRALDSTLHRDVAIKEYLPTTLALREGRTTVLPRSPEHAEQFAWGRERFLDEARILARLDRTSSIIRAFDFLEANGTAYMVMALVEGETLHKRLQREQRLTPDRADRLSAARRAGGGPCRDLPASRHQAGQHHARRPGPADPDRLRRVARRDGRTLDHHD